MYVYLDVQVAVSAGLIKWKSMYNDGTLKIKTNNALNTYGGMIVDGLVCEKYKLTHH